MRKYKHYHIIVLFGGILLFAETAYAFWPVFDFTEIIPIGKDVKSGIDTVKELKNQLNMKDGTLNAIGRETNSFAMFGKGVKKSSGSGKKSANNALSTTQNGENATKETTTETSNAASSTVNTQQEMVDDYVNQTQDILGGAQKLKTPEKSFPFIMSENTVGQNIVFEEEEEEEEVDTKAVEEEIRVLQSASLAEHKQLAVELNDILDTQLTLLNKSATDNMNALTALDTAIQQQKKISQDNKRNLQEKILQISERQRKTSDWAIRIVESVKENYNKEYNNAIKDGINNYTKVVMAYIRGDASHESMINAGEKLKKSVKLINVTPDAGVLNELYKETADVRSDVEKLVAEVNEILNDTQKT